ncbi:TIGR03621 family F420-dependent LLM class oxidoreductase [Dictyobacter formicarum]|uniref:LLM class F420-dependent oxidoreductase n=1 Tax=Dictyobacter formicarum TaxID=2778368 RepID=A0ABQ3VV81_9CHLR|nr:TIGR03621 family F420-dependent LLM class oxidoreductase [Dictyobacter formicarum]GHO89661.1 LLM class F420-dependent oxidoreductase [Dictyobacter formicarum]
MQRPFRFGVICGAFSSAANWREQARKIEDLGYSTLLVPDSLHMMFDPLVALTIAADATTTLRIGSYVFCNDFRHPALLAKGVATLDSLSGGRFEFGLGAGYSVADYNLAAIPYDSAGVRINRFEESIQVMKQLFTQEAVTFHGKYYTLNDMQAPLKPIQKPYPPIFIGGGGKRMLSIAAREASIIGINAINKAQGMDVTDSTPQALEQKVAWIREAAGERINDLELACPVFRMVLSDSRGQSDQVFQRGGPVMASELGSVQESMHTLVGSIDQIVETLLERRERYGISYIQITANLLDAFTPIVSRLAGQ